MGPFGNHEYFHLEELPVHSILRNNEAVEGTRGIEYSTVQYSMWISSITGQGVAPPHRPKFQWRLIVLGTEDSIFVRYENLSYQPACKAAASCCSQQCTSTCTSAVVYRIVVEGGRGAEEFPKDYVRYTLD